MCFVVRHGYNLSSVFSRAKAQYITQIVLILGGYFGALCAFVVTASRGWRALGACAITKKERAEGPFHSLLESRSLALDTTLTRRASAARRGDGVLHDEGVEGAAGVVVPHSPDVATLAPGDIRVYSHSIQDVVIAVVVGAGDCIPCRG